MLPTPQRRWASVVAALIVVAGCSATAASKSASSVTRPRSTSLPSTTITHTTTPLPDVVDGIPLRRLTELVRSPAAGWSEPHPFNIRVAVGSDRAANALMGRDGATYDYGDTARAYVVALDGHFACNPPGCVGSHGPVGPSAESAPPHVTTTVPSAVPVSTMVLTFDPKTLQGGGGLRVVGHEVDMNKLGRVYSLDPYR
jgi:hypothetical protein